MKTEKRNYVVAGMTVGESGKIVGYASVFNSLSLDLGGFQERVAPGAFDRALSQGQDVRALWNHDANYVLGRTKSGTLTISKDERGLSIEIDPPDVGWVNDLRKSIERKDVDQMSFQFRTVKDSWDEVDGKIIRTLIDVDLFDVSPVTFPAYEDTELQLRSMDTAPAEIRAKLEKNGQPQGEEKGEVGAGSGEPAVEWEQSQERLKLTRLNLDLAEKS